MNKEPQLFCLVFNTSTLSWVRVGLWYLTPFQHNFSFIIAVTFVGGGNRSTVQNYWPCASRRQTLSHIVVSVHLPMNGVRTHSFSGERH